MSVEGASVTEWPDLVWDEGPDDESDVLDWLYCTGLMEWKHIDCE